LQRKQATCEIDYLQDRCPIGTLYLVFRNARKTRNARDQAFFCCIPEPYDFLKRIIYTLSSLLIHTNHLWKSLTANIATITLNLWSFTMTIGNKHLQLLVTNFFWHFPHKIVVMKVQVFCKNKNIRSVRRKAEWLMPQCSGSCYSLRFGSFANSFGIVPDSWLAYKSMISAKSTS